MDQFNRREYTKNRLNQANRNNLKYLSKYGKEEYIYEKLRKNM